MWNCLTSQVLQTYVIWNFQRAPHKVDRQAFYHNFLRGNDDLQIKKLECHVVKTTMAQSHIWSHADTESWGLSFTPSPPCHTHALFLVQGICVVVWFVVSSKASGSSKSSRLSLFFGWFGLNEMTLSLTSGFFGDYPERAHNKFL